MLIIFLNKVHFFNFCCIIHKDVGVKSLEFMICILNHVVTCHIVYHTLYDILAKLPFDPDIIT